MEIPTELVNLLFDNRIIIGAVASTINDRYKKFINFSIPISIQPYSFIVAKPKELSRIYLFTAPYTHGVSFSVIKLMLNKSAEIFFNRPGSAWLRWLQFYRRFCASWTDSVRSTNFTINAPRKDFSSSAIAFGTFMEHFYSKVDCTCRKLTRAGWLLVNLSGSIKA